MDLFYKTMDLKDFRILNLLYECMHDVDYVVCGETRLYVLSSSLDQADSSNSCLGECQECTVPIIYYSYTN